MYKKFPNLFPKVYYKNNNIIIIEYIKHSKSKNINYKDLAYKIAKIHKNKNNKFGFDFDTPIGGLRQPSSYNNS